MTSWSKGTRLLFESAMELSNPGRYNEVVAPTQHRAVHQRRHPHRWLQYFAGPRHRCRGALAGRRECEGRQRPRDRPAPSLPPADGLPALLTTTGVRYDEALGLRAVLGHPDPAPEAPVLPVAARVSADGGFVLSVGRSIHAIAQRQSADLGGV